MSDGIINVAIEDALAHAATEVDRHTTLRVGLLLIVEYLAREIGRAKAADALRDARGFVLHAQPSPPWPD